MRIGLLSDTHGFLDEAVFPYFADCDEVWHAGDFGTIDVLRALREFKPLRGVSGNVDGAEIRVEVPSDEGWECEGVRVFMTHVGGYPGNYDARAKKKLSVIRPGLFVCGHSHVLRVMRDPALDLVFLNPGACGRQGWHKVRTLLRFEILQGKIGSVEAIKLGPRSASVRANSLS